MAVQELIVRRQCQSLGQRQTFSAQLFFGKLQRKKSTMSRHWQVECIIQCEAAGCMAGCLQKDFSASNVVGTRIGSRGLREGNRNAVMAGFKRKLP